MDTSAPKLPNEQKCPHCGMTHDTTCPRIRAIEYHPNGQIKRIEFMPPLVTYTPNNLTAEDIYGMSRR